MAAKSLVQEAPHSWNDAITELPPAKPYQFHPRPTPMDGLDEGLLPPRGVEQVPNSPVKSGFSESGGAKSGALGAQGGVIDPELRAIIDAWPVLPDAIKVGILAMVRTASGAK